MLVTYRGSGSFSVTHQKKDLVFSQTEEGIVPNALCNCVTCAHYPSDVVSQTIIQEPGEFEIQGVSLRGLQVCRIDQNEGFMFEIAYVISFNNFSFCFLGNYSHDIPSDVWEQIDECDVLFFPVTTANLDRVGIFMKNTDPRISFPYSPTDNSDDINAFCKSRGILLPHQQDHYMLNPNNIVPEEEKIIILSK